MTALSSIISAGGGGGGGSFPTFFLSTSQTWVPPMDGNICIHVIGAGGSGSSHHYTYMMPGAAGGYSRLNSTAVTTSDSIVCIVGAGGSRVSGDNWGTTGGYSRATFSTGPQVSGYGGAGGGLNQPTSAIGGGASGGDVNNYGGNGVQYKGGGAVGITGTGNTGTSHYNPTQHSGDGGDCDVIGDLWSSSLGNIAGGNGGLGNWSLYDDGVLMAPRNNAQGPFAGGGQTHNVHQVTTYYARGGDAIIGGGGGQCSSGAYPHSGYQNHAISGKGGEGLIVIQYIP